jgi:hypothetical protein
MRADQARAAGDGEASVCDFHARVFPSMRMAVQCRREIKLSTVDEIGLQRVPKNSPCNAGRIDHNETYTVPLSRWRVEKRKMVMATLAETGAVERLTGLVDAPDRYDYSAKDLREAQVAAMNERFQDRVGRIKLLKLRAEEAGINEIRSLEDAVPLLLPHTAYKSYPESFLMDEKWDKLSKWLDSVSTHRVPAIDAAEVRDVDHWIARLQESGHNV